MTAGPCCSIGARPDGADISAALLAGESVRAIVRRTGAPKTTLLRHRAGCLGLGGAEATTETEDVAPAAPGDPAESAADRPSRESGPPPKRGVDRPAKPDELPVDLGGPPSASRDAVHPPGPPEEKTRAERGKTAPRRLIAAGTEERCLELRVKGYTYEEITAETGIPASTAQSAVDRVLQRTRGHASETAIALREIEVRRCLALIKSLYDRATDPAMATVDVLADTESGVKAYDGQDKAADRLLKAMERLSKLMGLDAPVKQEITFEQLQAHPLIAEMQAVTMRVLERHPEALADYVAELEQMKAPRALPVRST